MDGVAIAAFLKPMALLVAENLCLRQQLIVLQRRQSRPRLLHTDRQFWIQARRWYSGWRDMLLIVQPETGPIDAGARDPGREADATRFRRHSADPADGFRQPLLGSAKDPSRAGEARVQGLCPHRSEVHAPGYF
jgi:hypothetical protein